MQLIESIILAIFILFLAHFCYPKYCYYIDTFTIILEIILLNNIVELAL